MSIRVEYMKQSANLFRKYLTFSLGIKEGSIEKSILHLVDLRASQMNGCAFCVDMHVKEAKIAGERELRLHHVAVWRESTLFNERERAALEWTEVLTKLPPHGVPDEIFNKVREQLSEQEISDLTFAIVAINGWNRLSIGFKAVPGSQDEAYGLTKAGLN
ncbi:MAG: carboxymuconolactone decarboxylase family protein [Acidobacteria bacterium]|nr:carboxymuconolactone decarboxylase family protein [Acidobacteriota bacterium]MBW4045889.1 carboxymuconolactone decarboxylase family protein [Acidobacteriota bacterium]